jgi:hypothetical protein
MAIVPALSLAPAERRRPVDAVPESGSAMLDEDEVHVWLQPHP